MSNSLSSLLLAGCFLTLGCAPQGAPKSPQHSDEETHGVADSERLLYRPQGDPASLLGREVFREANGTYRIAEERRPTCSVQAREVPEQWQRAYSDKVEDTAGGGVSLPQVAELRAKYDASVSVAVAIDNTARIDADIEGDCGEVFIRSVRVGTGERFIGKKSDVEAAAAVSIKGVGVGGGSEHSRESVERFSWTHPQAWSFTFGSMESSSGVQLAVRMPVEVKDGEQYQIEIRSEVDAWLIVYGREEDGTLFKLLPNMEHPRVHMSAGEWRRLPKLQAGLRDPAVDTQDTIIVYAFDDAAYAKRFKMPSGAASPAQMNSWEERIKSELKSVGHRHWKREEVGFRIVPKGE